MDLQSYIDNFNAKRNAWQTACACQGNNSAYARSLAADASAAKVALQRYCQRHDIKLEGIT